MCNAAADPMFWSRGRELLNVVSTADIKDEAFGSLQSQLSDRLIFPLDDIPSLAVSEPATLAGGPEQKKGNGGFSKFSVVESLLSLIHRQKHKALQEDGSPLDIRLNCTTKSILMNGENAVGLETTQGVMNLDGDHTKVVLCAGVSIYP